MQHTDDLRNVQEGDSVEITTTEGNTFDAKCVNQEMQRADPRSGEVRETRVWDFKAFGEPEVTIFATITDGLRSSKDDPEFPVHSELWNQTMEENMGYIESISIYGKIQN